MSASSPDVTITVSLSFDRFHPPLPIADLGQINAVLDDVLMMLGQFIAHELHEISNAITKLGHTVYHVHHEVIAVEVVAHRRGGGRGGRARGRGAARGRGG